MLYKKRKNLTHLCSDGTPRLHSLRVKDDQSCCCDAIKIGFGTVFFISIYSHLKDRRNYITVALWINSTHSLLRITSPEIITILKRMSGIILSINLELKFKCYFTLQTQAICGKGNWSFQWWAVRWVTDGEWVSFMFWPSILSRLL